MKYCAIVPARSGSKRLPNKNIKKLAGKPLVVWTLEACINASPVEKVILSTDSQEYWEIAREHIKSDKLILDFRDSEDAGDNVKIFDYLKSRHSKIFPDKEGAFILALPTVPLRTSNQIEAAIQMYEKEKVPVFSATGYGFPISFAFSESETGGWDPVFDDNPMVTGNTRSQNQKGYLHPNGAIYVRAIADLAHEEIKTLYEGAKPFIMDRDSSIDIDNEVDFKIAEAMLKY